MNILMFIEIHNRKMLTPSVLVQRIPSILRFNLMIRGIEVYTRGDSDQADGPWKMDNEVDVQSVSF